MCVLTRNVNKFMRSIKLDGALLLARLVLSATFLFAGLAKISDLRGCRQMLVDFGLPRALSNSTALFLTMAELVAGFALISSVSAFWGAVVAIVLLFSFIVGIGFNLLSGRRPDCRCFGQVRPTPIGSGTLARNAGLMCLALLVVVRGSSQVGPDPWIWLGRLNVTQRWEVVLGVCVFTGLAAEAWLLLNILRQNGRLLLRLEALEANLSSSNGVGVPPYQAGLPVGSLAPTFGLPDRSGATLTLDELRAKGKTVLLIFSDPDCPTCESMSPSIAKWRRETADFLTIAVISRDGPIHDHVDKGRQPVSPVLLQKDHEVAESFGCMRVPGAVLIDSDGFIRSPLAMGVIAIETLVSLTTRSREELAKTQPLNNSQPGPEANEEVFQIADIPVDPLTRDLSSHRTSLGDFRGRPVLLLFWNPSCVYCTQMQNDLKAWQSDPPEGLPQIVMITSGSVEQNERMGLKFPLILNRNAELNRSFGVRGTPSAILLDCQGKIASRLAVGSSAVLALATMSTHSGSAFQIPRG
jgi:peroxiredoxin